MFYTGVCYSFTEIKNAIVDVCTSNGWTATTDSGGQTVIYKDTMFLRIISESVRVRFLGRTSIDGGSAPYDGCITNYQTDAGREGVITFPVIYYAFIFDYEVFFVIEYGERFQYVAFGKSTYTLPGTGMWISASAGYYGGVPYYITLNIYGDVTNADGNTVPALFWVKRNDRGGYRNSWIHTNIDPNYPWATGTTNTSTDLVGIQYLTELISAQPNYFNQEALLLPIKAFKRSVVYADKCHEVLTVQNARHFNLTYVQPKDIIYRGSEQWMVFPWFRRSFSPYGWAIRKV